LSKQQHRKAQEAKGSSIQQPDRKVNGDSALQEQEQLVNSNLPAGQLATIPSGPNTQSIRRQAVLQLQKSHGNAFVMRHVMPQLQRQEEQASAGPEEGGGPHEISNGGSVVRVTPGSVEISGATVSVDAAMTNVNGVLRTSTLIADSVVASSYTPGAGNIM
jgi:hypothetical protein